MSGVHENEPYVARMPHAPILIPDIAGERSRDVVSSQSWMAQAGKEIAATDPDIVVLVSPHSPRKRDAFGVYRPTMLRGVLDQFGWHQPFFEFSNNLNLANDIQQHGIDAGLRFFVSQQTVWIMARQCHRISQVRQNGLEISWSPVWDLMKAACWKSWTQAFVQHAMIKVSLLP